MKYQIIKGWKYRLVEDVLVETSVSPGKLLREPNGFITLSSTGTILVKAGYSWDGASGPAIDTKDFMVASLIHDALYQLIRIKLLDKEFRKAADQTLYSLCILSGMSWWRAQYVYLAVRLFGSGNSSHEFEGDKGTIYEV